MVGIVRFGSVWRVFRPEFAANPLEIVKEADFEEVVWGQTRGGTTGKSPSYYYYLFIYKTLVDPLGSTAQGLIFSEA